MISVIEKASDMVANIGELPPIPLVILESMKLLNDPHSTVKKIQEQILLDQALTAFILKVANSALFGWRKRVSTVSHAINLMGYNTTRSILTAYLSKNLYSGKGNKLIQTMLWKHAISSAIFGRQLSGYSKQVNSEEAFISALLHDIGKGVLLKNKTEKFEEIIQLIYNETQTSVNAERRILDYTHIEVGYLLMKNWRFSDHIIETVIYHHNVNEYTGDNLLVPIVSMANKLSHSNNYTFDKQEEELTELKMLKISETDLEKIQHQANEEIEKSLDIF